MPILLLVLALQAALVPGATTFAAIARYDSARLAASAGPGGLP
ncbi:hypothetical protein ACKI2N_020240 [Cupriavidus sp. 30B13]